MLVATFAQAYSLFCANFCPRVSDRARRRLLAAWALAVLSWWGVGASWAQPCSVNPPVTVNSVLNLDAADLAGTAGVLAPYASFDGQTILVDLGERGLMVTSTGAIRVPAGSGLQPAAFHAPNGQHGTPHLTIRSDCDLFVQAAAWQTVSGDFRPVLGVIETEARKGRAGDVLLEFGGAIEILGSVNSRQIQSINNATSMAGAVALRALERGIAVGPTGTVFSWGEQPGTGLVSLEAGGPEGVSLEGLVFNRKEAQPHNPPRVEISALEGPVSIDASHLVLNDFKLLGNQKRDLTGGLLIAAQEDQAVGSIDILARGDIIVSRDVQNLVLNEESEAAVASLFQLSGDYHGAPIRAESLEGAMIASGRAFSAIGKKSNGEALIELMADTEGVSLLAPPALNAQHQPTLTTEPTSTAASAMGGISLLRSCAGGVSAAAGVQVLGDQALVAVSEGAPVSLDPGATLEGLEIGALGCDPNKITVYTVLGLDAADLPGTAGPLAPYATFNGQAIVVDLGALNLEVTPRGAIRVPAGNSLQLAAFHDGNDHGTPDLIIRSEGALLVRESTRDNAGRAIAGLIETEAQRGRAGDIWLEFQGDIEVRGSVQSYQNNNPDNATSTAGGIALRSLCGDVRLEEAGTILSWGERPGTNPIRLAACGAGNVEIRGLVLNRKHVTAANPPQIEVAAFGGNVLVNASTLVLNDFKLDAQKKDLAGGLLIASNDAAALGSIQVEAWGDVVIYRDASASLFDKESYAAVASVFSANQCQGAPIALRSFNGSIRARGRAVSSVGDHNNSAALVELFAEDDVVLESLASGAEAGPTLTVEDLWNNANAADGTVRLQSCQGNLSFQAGVQVRARESLLIVNEGAVSLDPGASVENPLPQLAACNEVSTLFAAGCSAFGSVSILDGNGDGLPDACVFDCDQDGVPDDQEIDCDNNSVPDDCQTFADCNGNGIPDSCDIALGTSLDCNGNGVPDACDLASGAAFDCNLNGIPDGCDITSGLSADCNVNGFLDECDLASGFSLDCNLNDIPDSCDIALGTSADCNDDGIPDSCNIASGASADCDNNNFPDECQPDCDADGSPDACETDCDEDEIPDDCAIDQEIVQDCNLNNRPYDKKPGFKRIYISGSLINIFQLLYAYFFSKHAMSDLFHKLYFLKNSRP